MGNTTKLRVFVKAIDNSHPNIEGATVYVYLYNSNSEHVQVTGVTQNNNGSYYFEVSQPNFDFITYVANAFYNGMESRNTNHLNVTANTVNDITLIINKYGNGYYFSLGKYNNFDTLFYYIGANIEVFPYEINVKSENNTNYYHNASVSSPSSLGTITGYCDTQYLYVEIIPSSNLYDSATFRYDLFSYPGGFIGEYITRVPRKKYVIETPFIFDTIVPPVGNILGYNLPNTDIRIKFYGWPDYNYNDILSSSISAITIWNSGITTNYCNHDWFYRCLAGNKIKPVESVKILLEKNHYIDVSDKMLTVSARTSIADSGSHSIPYSDTSETACYLYVCQNDPNGQGGKINVFEDRVETFTIQREPDAVFTRQEIEDYVRGFGFTYNGCFGLPTNGGRSFGFDSFTLPPTTKTPPSKQYFYEDATHNLQGAIVASNKDDFIDNFICALTCTNFYTEYTLTPELETHYTNNNNHCYVMEESIIPHSSPQPDYFYFYNHCGIPTGDVGSYSHEDLLTMDTNVGITLGKLGNPSQIQIQYSYNGHPWTDYEIGSELILLSGDRLYFKAKNQNQTFSLNENNFYYFSVNNTYQSENPNAPSYDTLINEYCIGGPNGKFDTDKIVNTIKYDVIVGGKISSLLNPSNHGGWENSTLNTYGFVNLFHQTKITNCYDAYHTYGGEKEYLKLDLLTATNYAYKTMFISTEYLIKGPKIAAENVGNYAMTNMFEYSSLSALTDNTLYFKSPASYCCYRMFAETNYNVQLTILSDNGGGASHFEQMFMKCYGENANVKFQNMTIFNTDACRRMFYSASTKVFSTFSNPISDIGMTAFYEMYSYSNITAVTFTVTGSVQYRGCMYMCSYLNSNSCTISSMHLDAPDLSEECYSYMFYYSKGAKGSFVFNIPTSIPLSGCCNMFQHTGEISCEILPALNLSNYCYAWMFCDCLISVAPELPATDLYEECYRSMFQASKITHHNHHNIHDGGLDNHTLDFNVGLGSKDIVEKDEYVLNATTLPTKCYSYMYAWSKLQHVSNIITSDLSVVGYQSCFHMFDGTPIFVTTRERLLYDKSRDTYLTARDFRMETIFVDGTYNVDDWEIIDGDTFFHLYKDYYFNGTNSDIQVLTGMTIGGVLGDRYTVQIDADHCNEVDVDGYFTTINSYDCFKLLTAKTGNDRFFEPWYGHTNTGARYQTATADRRRTMNIGKYPTYSYNEGTAITNSNYSFTTKREYVYLNATTVGEEGYAYMFNDCYNLIPGHNFKFSDSSHLVTASTRSFSHMFSKCKRIRTITLDLNNILPAPYCFEYMYAECYEKLGSHIFNWFNIEYLYQGLDYICYNIHTKYNNKIGRGDVFIFNEYCTNEYRDGNTHHFNEYGVYVNGNSMSGYSLNQPSASHYAYHMFDSCYAMRYAKIGLPNNTVSDGCYQAMFASCIQLVSGVTISSDITTTQSYCFAQMFMGCTDFIGPVNSIHKLSPTTMSNYAYSEMFKGCGSLSASPYLPSTNMVSNCYNMMFYTAFKYKISLEIKTTLTIKRHSNGNEENFRFYFCVSGTNDSLRTFWYFHNVSPIIENGYLQCYFYTNSVDDGYVLPNFTINGITAENLYWWNPDTEYFGSYSANAVSSLIEQLDDFLTDKYVLYHGNTGATRSGKITNHTTPEVFTGVGGTKYEVDKGLKVIKAQISKSKLESHDYTNEWVTGLDKISNGNYYGPGYQAATGVHTIPQGWSTHSS